MLWVGRRVTAPVDVVWDLLTDTRRWPQWGPTVRGVDVESDRIGPGSCGRVTTVAGLRLPFRVTAFDDDDDPDRSWTWQVAGVPATGHRVEPVEPLTGGISRVSIGVPWPAAPYLLVVWEGLRRLARLAETTATAATPLAEIVGVGR